MPADLDQLLRDAGRDTDPLDVDELWDSGRRRRLLRRVVTASTAIAVVAVVGIGAGSLAGVLGAGRLEIDPATEGEDTPEREAPAEEPEDVTDDAGDPEEVDEAETAVDDLPGVDQDEQTDDGDEPAVEDQSTDTVPADPTPDAAAVAEPCAAHQGREAEAFVAVSAPVAGQQVDGVIELVGCANVSEATVRYRLTDGSGGVLADDFTTATCGTGCLGEFRETIAVEGVTGQLVLAVFWEDAGDGSERDAVEVVLEAG